MRCGWTGQAPGRADFVTGRPARRSGLQQDLARVEQIRNPVQPDQEVGVKEPVPVAAVTGTTTAKPSLSARWFGRKR